MYMVLFRPHRVTVWCSLAASTISPKTYFHHTQTRIARRLEWPAKSTIQVQGQRHARLFHSEGGRRGTEHRQPFDILYFGRDDFSCRTLDHLHSARDVWRSIHIVTNPDVKRGRRGAELSVSPLKTLGQSLGLPVHTIPREKAAFKHWVPSSPFLRQPELPLSPPSNHLLITASFGRILPSSLLRLFPSGQCLNVHPSLLPAYRGAAPIQHALIRGEKRTGVCVIEMMERKNGIDAGGIWKQDDVAVSENADFASLRDILAHRGGALLVSVLREMLSGTATRTPQDPAVAALSPRAPAITADDALVDFTCMTAEEIIRRDRAIGHQKPLTTYLPSGKSIQLHALSVYDPKSSPSVPLPPLAIAHYHAPSRTLLIQCAQDTYLSVAQIKQQDRALLGARDWFNGVKGKIGVDFAEGGVRLVSTT
ncbi:hypothetical protein SERLADRAFT_359551 [Serpula lacrymans var. lacrymans S7.9]|uniref:methionyl-tRNA formyltransferase n=1 Tax=Serpula lacrymans var. lacrymans (strain S7.9) TaxID=578457 RepID=F8NGW4_SERL9|nr:uncharacterized protein SERLADRAFT_359551 [Serpula lacrymans var. lacrymans S7.9]EGO29606.1 hypothetical protein SERLADRAFT_359551 [Serpula lacrymans var. lacrymans S7.9]